MREAYAEGRLSPDEFDDRNSLALAAKTAADLAPLTADLPAPILDGEAAVAARRAESARRRELRKVWVAWASAAVVLTTVWALTAIGSDGVPAYWPAWPLGLTGAMALVRTLSLRGRSHDGEDGDPTSPRKSAPARRTDRRAPR